MLVLASARIDTKEGEIRTYWYVISVSMDRIGATGTFIGVGTVNGGGRRAMR